jgi:hypothetical protein
VKSDARYVDEDVVLVTGVPRNFPSEDGEGNQKINLEIY